MKIAVSSSDGFNIDQQFGQGESIYIFKRAGGKMNFLEIRNFKSAKDSNQQEKINHLLNQIKDCKIIYTKPLDNEVMKNLKNAGFHVLIREGEIMESISNQVPL
jgi:predicted Fe-Mo cluster-binding NifX family protein